MNRKHLAALAAATTVAAALSGCVTVAPERPAPSPVYPVPAQPAVIDQEAAFFDAIADGFVVRDMPRMDMPEARVLYDASLEAAHATCPVLDGPGGRPAAITIAEDALGNPDVFTADMPAIFVDAAAAHICR